MQRRSIFTVIALISGGWLATPALAGEQTLTGTVTYLDRRVLPPNAVLDVELVDSSRADAPSIRISSRR